MRLRVLLCCCCVLCASLAPALAETPEETLAAASALYDAQKFAPAAAKLEAFLKANPKSPKFGAAALTLARCYVEQKQFDKAIPAYEKASVSPDEKIVTMARLGLGEAATATGQYDKAITALEPLKKDALPSAQAAVVYVWLGQSYFARKRYEPAEAAYLRGAMEYSRSDVADSAWFGAALAALKLNKKDEARPRLQTVLDRYPNSPDRPQATLLLAQLSLDAKDYGQARNLFERALRDNATKAAYGAEAEDGLIQTLLEQKDYGAAAARLDSALARLPAADPQRFRAWLSLGQCRYRQQQFEPAYTAYVEAAKAVEPEVAAQGYYWAGNAALALKRNTDAAAQFAQCAAKFPQNALAARAELKAGDAWLAAKQNPQAAAAYRVVVDKYPKSAEAPEARKALSELVVSISDPAQLAAALKNVAPAQRNAERLRVARLYLESHKVSEAVPVLNRLLADKPAPDIAAEANYLLGLASEAQQKPAQATEALAEAVRVRPEAAWATDAQQHLTYLYLNSKQAAKAEKAANAALSGKLEPTEQEQMRLARMQAQARQQKWDAALADSQELLAGSAAPDTVAAALYTQAWINEKRGKPDAALPAWERLARDFPKNPDTADAFLHIGDARFTAKKFNEARDNYERLLSDFPQSPLAAEARFKLGSVLYNLEKYDEAAAAFRVVAADKTAGDYIPEALYWTGAALDKAGKKAEAIAPLSRLVEQYPAHSRVANAKVRLAALKAATGK